MLQKSKRSFRRRRLTTYMLLFLTILLFTTSPFLWRMNRLKQAESVYDFQMAREELQWWEMHGGLLNKLGMIKDASLWLELNIGDKNFEPELAMYQDDKHRFWLFLLNLQKGKLTEAKKVLNQLDKTSLSQLGLGVLSIAQGEVEESSRILTEPEIDWKDMPKQAQALRHLTLAQVAMSMGDLQATHNELEAAQRSDPHNPACLSVAFDIAVEEGQWATAHELSQKIKTQTWRPKSALFETKMAVLAIHENNRLELSNCLSTLKDLPQGEACINYVNGIYALSTGQLQEGKSLLEQALKRGLEGGLRADAQKSIDQLTERQNADRFLRSIALEITE